MAKIYSKLLPLAFYSSKADKQAQKDRNGDDNDTAILLCPKNTLIDFQIQRNSTPDTITDFKVYTENDVVEVDLDNDLISLITVTNENILLDILSYSHHELAGEIECGVYYIYVTDGTLEFYSDDFRVADYEMDFETNVGINTMTPINISISAGNNLII